MSATQDVVDALLLRNAPPRSRLLESFDALQSDLFTAWLRDSTDGETYSEWAVRRNVAGLDAWARASQEVLT